MPQSIALSQVLPILGAVVAFLFAALLVLYIFRLLFGQRIRAPAARNRARRLDIVDAFDLGRDRQLVIVRRDNVEHLLMIGGPNDILVEGAFARTEARDLRPAPARDHEASQPAGWPAAPTPQPLAAQAMSAIGDAIRRRPEPTAPPQPTSGAQPLPSDMFAPAAPARPSTPEAPPSPPPSRVAGRGVSPPPLRPAPSAPQPGAPRQSQQPPPFLARTQRTGAAAPGKREAPQTPAPSPTAAPAPPQEPATGADENATQPAQNPSNPDALNPLESLEAEMARLLGRPDPEK
jgi:flagellar protein FliO/FliZ